MRELSARSGLGRDASVGSGLGLGRENPVMGGLVIEEEDAGTRRSEEKDMDGLARVEMELKRLRELYSVREREREEMSTPTRRGERRVQWGTPGSLYDREGFLKD